MIPPYTNVTIVIAKHNASKKVGFLIPFSVANCDVFLFFHWSNDLFPPGWYFKYWNMTCFTVGNDTLYKLQTESSQGLLLLLWSWYPHFMPKHIHLGNRMCLLPERYDRCNSSSFLFNHFIAGLDEFNRHFKTQIWTIIWRSKVILLINCLNFQISSIMLYK